MLALVMGRVILNFRTRLRSLLCEVLSPHRDRHTFARQRGFTICGDLTLSILTTSDRDHVVTFESNPFPLRATLD